MIKLLLIIASLTALLFVESSFAAEKEPLTLVVGNCRRGSGVRPALAKLVEQKKADFTHTKSFSLGDGYENK